MKILIIEDDSISRKMLQTFLSEYGEIQTAENGKKAIELYKKALILKMPFNLIFLDQIMPEMGGLEVLKKIREIESDKKVGIINKAKVIIVTMLDDTSNIINAFESGCEGYIVKPINRAKLNEQLQKLKLI